MLNPREIDNNYCINSSNWCSFVPRSIVNTGNTVSIEIPWLWSDCSWMWQKYHEGLLYIVWKFQLLMIYFTKRVGSTDRMYWVLSNEYSHGGQLSGKVWDTFFVIKYQNTNLLLFRCNFKLNQTLGFFWNTTLIFISVVRSCLITLHPHLHGNCNY